MDDILASVSAQIRSHFDSKIQELEQKLKQESEKRQAAESKLQRLGQGADDLLNALSVVRGVLNDHTDPKNESTGGNMDRRIQAGVEAATQPLTNRLELCKAEAMEQDGEGVLRIREEVLAREKQADELKKTKALLDTATRQLQQMNHATNQNEKLAEHGQQSNILIDDSQANEDVKTGSSTASTPDSLNPLASPDQPTESGEKVQSNKRRKFLEGSKRMVAVSSSKPFDKADSMAVLNDAGASATPVEPANAAHASVPSPKGLLRGRFQHRAGLTELRADCVELKDLPKAKTMKINGMWRLITGYIHVRTVRQWLNSSTRDCACEFVDWGDSIWSQGRNAACDACRRMSRPCFTRWVQGGYRVFVMPGTAEAETGKEFDYL